MLLFSNLALHDDHYLENNKNDDVMKEKNIILNGGRFCNNNKRYILKNLHNLKAF